MMQGIPLSVWSRKGIEGGVNESCLINDKGNYVGISTGKVYDKMMFYHSKPLFAKVVYIDSEQQNGMIHLDPHDEHGINNINKKHSFIGCIMPFREAHFYGERTVYQSLITGEYYNDLEIEIIQQ